MQQRDQPGFELAQIAATLAAGMLSSRNPQSWSPDLDRNAAYAVEVYNACVRALSAHPPAGQPGNLPEAGRRAAAPRR